MDTKCLYLTIFKARNKLVQIRPSLNQAVFGFVVHPASPCAARALTEIGADVFNPLFGESNDWDCLTAAGAGAGLLLPLGDEDAYYVGLRKVCDFGG
jgi:hypothetical protein